MFRRIRCFLFGHHRNIDDLCGVIIEVCDRCNWVGRYFEYCNLEKPAQSPKMSPMTTPLTEEEVSILLKYVRNLWYGTGFERLAAEWREQRRELSDLRKRLAEIIGSASHVKLGKTTEEIRDGIIRWHDQICDLQEERDNLRAPASRWPMHCNG